MVRGIVLDVLDTCQEVSGRARRELADDQKVVGGLDGFDSISGIEATTLLEQRLVAAGLLTELAVTSAFIRDQVPLTLGGCVDFLLTQISEGRGNV